MCVGFSCPLNRVLICLFLLVDASVEDRQDDLSFAGISPTRGMRIEKEKEKEKMIMTMMMRMV